MGMIYNKKLIKSLSLVLLISLGVLAEAQTIPEEEVTVIAPYSPTISKAQKLSQFPAIEENTVTKFKLDYYTNPKLISSTFDLANLKAARYVSPKDPKYKQNVLQAGFGLYTTPYAELFLNGKLKKGFTFGVHARHLSSKASVEDFAYSGFSNSGAEIWGKKTASNYVLWFSGFYQRDAFHYYGFKPNDFLSEFNPLPNFDTLTAQIFSDAGVKFYSYNTTNKKSDSYRVDGSYRYFWDRFNNREILIDLSGDYERPVDFLSLKNQYLGIGINSEVAITNWEAPGQLVSPFALLTPEQLFHGKVDAQLAYSLQYDRFDIKVGGIVAIGLGSASTLKVYPDMMLNVNVIKNILDVYAQFDGGLISPTYYSVSRENPFVAAFLPLNYSSRTYHLKGGLKANIAGYADLHLWGSTERVKNAAFFTSDTLSTLGNQFTLLYDNIDLLQFGADLNIGIGNILFGTKLMYQEYTMTNEAQAWYKPAWSGQISADYMLWDNLKLSMALKAQSSVWAKVGLDQVEIDSWFDLSAGATYHINRQFSAFVNVSNLLSQNYQLWYNYPVKGFGAMAGVSYAF